jgi:hypothetical protein
VEFEGLLATQDRYSGIREEAPSTIGANRPCLSCKIGRGTSRATSRTPKPCSKTIGGSRRDGPVVGVKRDGDRAQVGRVLGDESRCIGTSEEARHRQDFETLV